MGMPGIDNSGTINSLKLIAETAHQASRAVMDVLERHHAEMKTMDEQIDAKKEDELLLVKGKLNNIESLINSDPAKAAQLLKELKTSPECKGLEQKIPNLTKKLGNLEKLVDRKVANNSSKPKESGPDILSGAEIMNNDENGSINLSV